jgi:hypothetical protein
MLRSKWLVSWSCVVALAGGCTTHRQAMVGVGVGVGMVALGVLAVRAATQGDDGAIGLLEAGGVFVLGGSALVIGSGLSAMRLDAPLASDGEGQGMREAHRARARSLTAAAATAAAAGDCTSVPNVERYVRAYDPELYDDVFSRDPAIQRCLAR